MSTVLIKKEVLSLMTFFLLPRFLDEIYNFHTKYTVTFVSNSIGFISTGILMQWSGEILYCAGPKRFHAHRQRPPWIAFQRISDDDWKAIYRFLNILKSINNMLNMVALPPEGIE